MSPTGWNEALISQASGATNRIAPGTRISVREAAGSTSRGAPARARRRPAARRPARDGRSAARRRRVTVRPPVEAQLQRGEDQQHQEQRERERAGVAHLVELECRLVDVVDHRGRPVDRPAAGHHEDLREHLERADDADDQEEQRGRAQHRQRDVARNRGQAPAPSISRRLVQLLGDRLQPGEVDDHREPDAGPHGHQHHGRHRQVLVGQPQQRLVDQLGLEQVEVEQPEVAVVEPLPDDRDDDERRDERQEVERPQQRPAAQRLVEQQRDASPNEHASGTEAPVK